MEALIGLYLKVTFLALCIACNGSTFASEAEDFCATAENRSPRHYAKECESYGCRSSFIRCEDTDGDGDVMPCPTGLIWNDKTRRCDWGMHLYVRSMACEDRMDDSIRLRSQFACGSAAIQVNGVEHSLANRGLNAVIIEYATGIVFGSATFDTYFDETAEPRLLEYIHNAPDESVIVVAAQDEASGSLTVNLTVTALQEIGFPNIPLSFRESMIALGLKGTAEEKPAWARWKVSAKRRGPTFNEEFIPIG